MTRMSAEHTSQPLLDVRSVTYRYLHATEERPALDGVSLRVRAGEYVALLGHNGSGKSTLARLLNALLVPDDGSVLVAGLDTRSPATRQRIRELVGMIFSDPDNQIVATVVEDDVAWGLAARGWPREEIRSRVRAALEAVDLSAAAGRPPHELSGGQRQRVAIAGVLALEPACIVADEPTAMLDPRTRIEVCRLLARLNREHGLTVVHVTHALEETLAAHRIMVLERGRMVWEGTPAGLLADLTRVRSLGLIVPEMAALGERLRGLGVPVPFDTLSPEALLAAVEAAS